MELVGARPKLYFYCTFCSIAIVFLNAQTTQSLDLIRHGMLSIKVMLRLYATNIWVLVKSNSVARVETRSSLVGLCGSGWAQIQQAAPLEVDAIWVSKSLSWL